MTTDATDAVGATTWAGVPYLQRVLGALARDPDRTVLTEPEGRTTTAGSLAAAVGTAARALAPCGVRAGGVALLTRANRRDSLVARYAAHLLGAPVVHARASNPRADGDQLAREHQLLLLSRTAPRVLVVDEDHVARGRDLRAALPAETLLASFDDLGDDVLPLGRADDADGLPSPVAPAPDDLAVVGLTSGTTGAPKAVAQSFATWERTVRAFSGRDPDGEPSVFLAVTPLTHTTGSMADAVLAAGGRVLAHETFDAARVWDTVSTARVSAAYVAVPHLHRMLDHAARNPVDPSSLRRLVYSGSPASPRRVGEAVRLFGDALLQLYGSAEAGGISTLTPLDHAEPALRGTVGRPFPHVEVALCDEHTGAPVPREQVGEVWVRSPTVMQGYVGEPDVTADTLREGWLRTGDLAEWDRHGYLRLVGRVGDVVKSGGLKVLPETVERALLEHPDVAAAAAFAAAGPDEVEAVHAAVVPGHGRTTDPASVRGHVAALLDAAHVPVDVAVLDALPLTASGKPDRRALRASVRTAEPGSLHARTDGTATTESPVPAVRVPRATDGGRGQ